MHIPSFQSFYLKEQKKDSRGYYPSLPTRPQKFVFFCLIEILPFLKLKSKNTE